MPLFAGVALANQFTYSPRLYVLDTGQADFTQFTLPTNVTANSQRPCFVPYRRRLYVLGMFTPNIVIDEHRKVWTMGIHAPLAAPTLGTGGGTGLTGAYIGYITFVQKDEQGKVIHESNLSEGSSEFSASNQNRSWGNLPITSQDPRVTHKRGYVSVGGAVPRLVWEREIATAGPVVESVSDSVVANQTPAPVDANEQLTHGRGVPAYYRFGAIWRDRLWGVGDPGDVVSFSELFEPESAKVDPDQKFAYSNTLRTKGGESIIGLTPFEDGLVLHCVNAEYVITGYGATSFEMRRISNVTSLSHHGGANCHGGIIYPTANGLGFRQAPAEGAFRNIFARNYTDQWATNYVADPLPYESSQGVYDSRSGNYILLTSPATAPKTLCYVVPAKLIVEEGNLDPPLMKWIQTRESTSVAVWSAVGAKQPTVVFGAADGYVRKMDATDENDDGDAYSKAATIRHKHFFFGDQGGDDDHGRTFHFFDVFAKTENQNATFKAYPGDDDAASGVAPFSETIEASAVSGKVAKTSHRIASEDLSGKGVTVEITVSSPVGFEYRGFATEHSEGVQQRLPTS